MGNVSLRAISSEISSCQAKQIGPDDPTIVEVLTRACALRSQYLMYLIPKVVLVDRYLQANVIKYVSKADESKEDYRFGYYYDIAVEIKELDLDSRIEKIKQTAQRLSDENAYDVAILVSEVSNIVKGVTGRNALVFASKLLHFCSVDVFPAMDNHADNELAKVFTRLNEKGAKVIKQMRLDIDRGLDRGLLLEIWWESYPEVYNQYWHDDIIGAELLKILEENHSDKYRELQSRMGKDRYMLFVRDILCLQQAICHEGGPCFSLRELDHYLYGRGVGVF